MCSGVNQVSILAWTVSYLYSYHFPSTDIFGYYFIVFWTTKYIHIFFVKGPGTWASLSPVSDYWTNWPSVEVLAFVKDARKVEILNLEPKKIGAVFADVF